MQNVQPSRDVVSMNQAVANTSVPIQYLPSTQQSIHPSQPTIPIPSRHIAHSHTVVVDPADMETNVNSYEKPTHRRRLGGNHEMHERIRGDDRKEKRIIIVLVTRRVRILILLDLIFEIIGTELGGSQKK